MIRVVHSNRVEALVDALAEALPAPGDATGVFDGPWLVVPSRPLTLWLNLELARRRGISGQVDTMTFDGLFARLTAESQPDVVLIERGHIVGELLTLLSDARLLAAGALAPFASYLRAAGEDPAAIDRRRVDLSLALGRLFDDWTMTRPDALKTWRSAPWRSAPSEVDRALSEVAPRPSEVDRALSEVAPRPSEVEPRLSEVEPRLSEVEPRLSEVAPRLSEVEASLPAVERAERVLFAALFGTSGRFAARGGLEGRRYLTRDAFLGAGLESRWRPPPAVHLFAPHDVSPGVQLTLARLGLRTNVHIYAVNPCREFWEDLETGHRPPGPPVTLMAAPPGRAKGRGRQAAPNPRQLDLLAPMTTPPAPPAADAAAPAATPPAPTRENPWLGAWGRAGREVITRLNALTDQNVEFRPGPDGDSTAGSLLLHIQRDMLERRPRRERDDHLGLEADGSITLLGAPNPRREIESVAAEIWRLVRTDEAAARAASDAGREHHPLGFSDIAVLVAGPPDPHLSLVPEVFHEAEELPHAIVDRGFGARSGLADAVLALVALPLGPLTRREVLDVVTHANVRARFPDADPAAWLRLCDALTIAHGADREAHAGMYIDRDAFNWDQGCRRLVLGRLARGPRSGAEDPVVLAPHDEAGYIPAEVGAHLRDDAAALVVLLRSLLADIRFARAAHLTVPDWTRFVRALMAAYVVPVTPEDESARLAVLAALDQLATQAAPQTTVPLAVAVELLRAALADLRGARGQMLGAGVVVGSLGTLRALPFRVVFVVGLEPHRFPSARGPSPLDVLAGVGAAPEVSPRDTDRYLFLEALLAARERLVLTALDRDPLTGDPREPSSVVLDLMDELARGYAKDPTALVRQVPLHRDEDESIRAAFPAAASEAQARALGEAARAAGAPGADDPATFIRALAPAARTSLTPLLGLISPAIPTPETAPGTARRPRTSLNLIDLRRFLECPLQGGARVYLGLRDLPDESDARDTADEPFDLPRMLERGLLNEVMVAAWTDGAPPDPQQVARRYDEATARHRAAHRLPAAMFRSNVRLRHLRILGQWLERMASAAPTLRGPARRICFGRPEPFAPPAELRDPIRLHVELPERGTVEVELQGSTEPQVHMASEGLDGSLILSASAYGDQDDRDSVRGLIDAMAIVASSPPGAPPATRFALVCRPSRSPYVTAPSPYLLRFSNVDVAEARAYLAGLATALLGRLHDYLFPIDAVMRATDKPMPLVDAIEQTRVDPFYGPASAANFGPVPNPFEYPAPSEADAVRFRQERLGPLLAARAVARGKVKEGDASAGETLAEVVPINANGRSRGRRS